MKKVVAALLCAMALAGTGCAYGGVSMAGDKAVVLRNDAFLFGLLNMAYVCKVSDEGLTNCNSSVNP